MISLADPGGEYRLLESEIDAAVKRVLSSGRYVLGPEVAAFEREMATSHRHAIGVSSGSDALVAALWAVGVEPKQEVITSTFSFFASAGAIARLGATPVFADIDPTTLTIGELPITPRTRAILPVHLFGRPAAVNTTLPVVEDAAQAVASSALGALAAISFFPTKNLGAAGDAGMVLVDDDEWADRIRLYRSHGARPKYEHHVVGANFRLDEIQAAILRVKRPYLERWTAARRKNAFAYLERLAGLLELPTDAPGHVWHHFVVRCDRRDALQAYLATLQIESAVYYPKPLHQQAPFATGQSLPNAERACREVLALPVHPLLTIDEIDQVCDAIREFING